MLTQIYQFVDFRSDYKVNFIVHLCYWKFKDVSVVISYYLW